MRTIELKRVKYLEANARDSHCFSATVYLDGKRFCLASDDGFGGQERFEAIRPKGGFKTGGEAGKADREVDATIKKIDAELDNEFGAWKHKRKDGSEFTVQVQTFAGVVCDLVNNWLADRDIKRDLSRKWVWQRTDGKVMESRRKTGQKAVVMQEVIRKEEPGAKLLQLLTMQECRDIYSSLAD